jgi:hypothetical protein
MSNRVSDLPCASLYNGSRNDKVRRALSMLAPVYPNAATGPYLLCCHNELDRRL